MIRYYFFRVLKKIFGKKLFYVYWTAKGLKNYNIGRLSILNNPFVLNEKNLNANELFLGPDYLRDEYTLIDVNIVDSPHYSFMQALSTHQELENTEYIKRKKVGSLDWRDAEPVRSGFLLRAQDKFKTREEEIMSNQYEPITVYEHNGRFYIYDGKHRAALCALLNKPIKCKIVSCDCVTSYNGFYFSELIKEKTAYSRHNHFFFSKE